jgi:hypothetical protein
MPTSHGILDRALYRMRDEFPESFRASLTFSTTAVGLRCLELPAILLAAREALLTSEPNPTYLSTVVKMDEDAARQVALDFDLTTRTAREIGERLHKAVGDIREEIGNLQIVAA